MDYSGLALVRDLRKLLCNCLFQGTEADWTGTAGFFSAGYSYGGRASYRALLLINAPPHGVVVNLGPGPFLVLYSRICGH